LGSAAVPPGSGADGNQNGVIDGGDLAVWQGSFGGTASSVIVGSSLADAVAAEAFSARTADLQMAGLSLQSSDSHSARPLRRLLLEKRRRAEFADRDEAIAVWVNHRAVRVGMFGLENPEKENVRDRALAMVSEALDRQPPRHRWGLGSRMLRRSFE
jgi:hypothetical protein